MAEVPLRVQVSCADSRWRCGRKSFASPPEHVMPIIHPNPTAIPRYRPRLKVQGIKYNLRHKIKEIVLRNNGKHWMDTC